MSNRKFRYLLVGFVLGQRVKNDGTSSTRTRTRVSGNTRITLKETLSDNIYRKLSNHTIFVYGGRLLQLIQCESHTKVISWNPNWNLDVVNIATFIQPLDTELPSVKLV